MVRGCRPTHASRPSRHARSRQTSRIQSQFTRPLWTTLLLSAGSPAYFRNEIRSPRRPIRFHESTISIAGLLCSPVSLSKNRLKRNLPQISIFNAKISEIPSLSLFWLFMSHTRTHSATCCHRTKCGRFRSNRWGRR